MKVIKLFNKIDTVHGICESCNEETILVAIVQDYYRCTNCGCDTKQYINGRIRYFYQRDERYAGKTKYPFLKMLKFALDGITSFSSVPLKVATVLGYITSMLALIYACSVFIQKLLGITVQGWATIMVGMLFLGGVQLICLGIMGEYIARIFNQTKQRPMYIIDEMYSAGDNLNLKVKRVAINTNIQNEEQ